MLYIIIWAHTCLTTKVEIKLQYHPNTCTCTHQSIYTCMSASEELGQEHPKTLPAKTAPTCDRGVQEAVLSATACGIGHVTVQIIPPSQELPAMTETNDQPLQKKTPLLHMYTLLQHVNFQQSTAKPCYYNYPLITCRILASVPATQRQICVHVELPSSEIRRPH